MLVSALCRKDTDESSEVEKESHRLHRRDREARVDERVLEVPVHVDHLRAIAQECCPKKMLLWIKSNLKGHRQISQISNS